MISEEDGNKQQDCRNKICDELNKFHNIPMTRELVAVIADQAIFLDERFKKLVADKLFYKTNIEKALREAECRMKEAECRTRVGCFLSEYHPHLLTPENIKIINHNAIKIDRQFHILSEQKSLDQAHIIEALKNIKPQNKELFNVALIGIFAGGMASGTTLALSSSAQAFVFKLLPFMPHTAAIGSAVAICAIGIAVLAVLVKMLMNHLESSKTVLHPEDLRLGCNACRQGL